MSYVHRGHMPLDYQPVHYEGSVLRFRGPKQDLDRPFILCLGGTETFGRFIHAPYAARLEAALPLPVVNMGVMNAGVDVILNDPVIQAAAHKAEAVVMQITGAQNMNNRFYTVHPRRNDRFLKASNMLRTIYRDVDFTEFHFTRHLLTHLRALSADRFGIVVAELQAAWAARMQGFLRDVAAPVHLLWISRRGPGPTAIGETDALLEDPLFITAEMMDALRPLAASLTIAVPDEQGGDGAPTKGMFFSAREKAAARVLPGPSVHDKAAEALKEILSDGIAGEKTPRIQAVCEASSS